MVLTLPFGAAFATEGSRSLARKKVSPAGLTRRGSLKAHSRRSEPSYPFSLSTDRMQAKRAPEARVPGAIHKAVHNSVDNPNKFFRDRDSRPGEGRRRALAKR